MRRLAWFILVCVGAGVSPAADRQEGTMFATRSVVYARHGMVAASHPLAVRIGVETLQDGGSAVDAAIAVNAALGFLEPVANGIGGDLFAIVWDAKERKLYGLNASGRSPKRLTADAHHVGIQGHYITGFWPVRGIKEAHSFAAGHVSLVGHPASYLPPKAIMIFILNPFAPAPCSVCSHKKDFSSSECFCDNQGDAAETVGF